MTDSTFVPSQYQAEDSIPQASSSCDVLYAVFNYAEQSLYDLVASSSG